VRSRRQATQVLGGTATSTEIRSDKPVPRQVPTIELTAMQEHNDALRVETNFVADGPVTLRVEGQTYESAARDGTAYTVRNVSVPKIGSNNAKLVIGDESVPFEITRTMNTIDEWRKYAKPFDFKVVNKNPGARTGEHVKGRARIYQIQEGTVDGENYSEGGLNVTPYGYGTWDDNVRFVMSGTTDFVEGDIVNYFGTITGSYSYESQAGWNITTPMLQIAYMTR
jgi:hypothetical protein